MHALAGELERSGFVVLRRAFDPSALDVEADRALRDGLVASFAAGVAGGVVSGGYVPMMSAHTPVSLALLDHFHTIAEALTGRPMLPGRAKIVRYLGGVAWHRDSDLPLTSLGFLAYLEPLGAEQGALRVIPRSHHTSTAAELTAHLATAYPPGATLAEKVGALPGHAVETHPGDVIVMHEHLFHASLGGSSRRQWRVDFVADPRGPDEESLTREYYRTIHRVGWDGGYDVDRYPTYGPSWVGSGRDYLPRLDALGAHAAADAEESWVRVHRRERRGSPP
ncbi:phytanoyl-CoA dioxygenase family protein [Myxococcota bacterium]|nr:phytanoyl-CoA dioxygenase family protein [Myxococcota bacterium]